MVSTPEWGRWLERATPYLRLQECASYAATHRRSAVAARQAIATKGREWGVAQNDESEGEQLAKVRALWKEIPLFALSLPPEIELGEAQAQGREATLLALRALPLNPLVRLFSENDYFSNSADLPHAQRSLLATPHPGRAKAVPLSRALSAACRAGQCEVATFLVEHGAQYNDLIESMRSRNFYINVAYNLALTQLLIERGGMAVGRRDNTGHALLDYVASESSPETLRFLLERGADPSAHGSHGETPLCFACRADMYEVEMVAALLEAGADPHGCDEEGNTPLFYARSQRTMELLLQAGVQIDHRNQSGDTVLFAVNDRPSLMALLLEAGANPNSSNEKGYTPLHNADFWKLPETVELLLAYGADPTLKTKNGMDVQTLADNHPILLHILTSSLNQPHQRELLAPPLPLLWDDVDSSPQAEEGEAHGAPLLVLRSYDLLHAIFGYLKVHDWARLSSLSKGAALAAARALALRASEWGIADAQQPQREQRAALRALWQELPLFLRLTLPSLQRRLRGRHRESVIRQLRALSSAELVALFSSPEYFDESRHTPHVERSLLAVPRRDKAEIYDASPLQRAGNARRTEVVSFLLDHGKWKDLSLPTSLLGSLSMSDCSLLELFFERALTTPETLERALVKAVQMGQLDVIELLLQRGVDPNLPSSDSSRQRLLHLSMDTRQGTRLLEGGAYQSLRLLELLLEAGADPNGCDTEGRTPLFLATSSAKIALLLSYGAEIDQRSLEGATALYAQVTMGRLGCVALLLQRGADPNTVVMGRRRGIRTPLTAALEYVHRPDIAALLLRAGADPALDPLEDPLSETHERRVSCIG